MEVGLPPGLSPAGFWYESIGSLDLSANTTYVLGTKYPFFALDIDWGTGVPRPRPGWELRLVMPGLLST